MKSGSKIIVVGSSNTDMVIRSKKMPRPGETVLGGSFMMNQGGKGANQAVAAAKLGGDTMFVAKVGDDVFGHQTIDILKNCGVNTRHVGISETLPSGVALINVDESGENCISVASGANAALMPSDIDAAESDIASAGILLMQLETPVETVAHAAAMAKKYGVTVVLNPAPAPAEKLPEGLLKNVDILIPNETEAEKISGQPVADRASAANAVDKIRKSGVGTVICTLGAEGCLVCDGDTCESFPAVKVRAVDTTAAGDTFCGALCVGLAEGLALGDAVTLANRAAAISVTRPGAQQSVPTRSEVDDFTNI